MKIILLFMDHTLQFSLQNSSEVTMDLVDLQGRKIKTISQGHFPEGIHKLNFSAEDLAKGTYLLQLKSGFKIESQKLIVQ